MLSFLLKCSVLKSGALNISHITVVGDTVIYFHTIVDNNCVYSGKPVDTMLQNTTLS